MNILTIKKNIYILYIKMDNIAWLFFTNSNITKNFNEIGRGFLYQEDGSGKIQKKLIENGNTFRCEYCGHYLICTGRPQLGWSVADYLTGGDMYFKGMLYNSIFEFRTDRSTTYYTSDNTIEGYRFK